MKRVVVGLSGGVDSSVAAYLLKEQGYEVIGLFMKNWEEEGSCSAADDLQDVVSVAHKLDIPYYSVNFAKEYWDRVFARCLKEYEAGYTPNPDILCNQEIKFQVFFEKARELGADYLATGHYCQKGEDSSLMRGADPNKDQSYFLYTMRKEVLNRVLFPVGHLPKSTVRQIAHEQGLITADKKDSTGICFIGKRNFKEFLSTFLKKQPGNFETMDGKCVGRHDGIPFYTIGQRRGLAIGGAGEAWYVVGKDPERNVVFVEQGEEHPALYQDHLVVQDLHWIQSTPSYPFRCTAKVRYRSADVACTLYEDGRVLFDTPQKALTPRQAIVFYKGEQCLGGGAIDVSFSQCIERVTN